MVLGFKISKIQVFLNIHKHVSNVCSGFWNSWIYGNQWI